jgi:NAD(P)-dependent dehydrogenase (short-subunit alcohol dehydrogenase family)
MDLSRQKEGVGEDMTGGKVAVVVGATGNIGQAVCEALRRADFSLDPQWLGADRPDATRAESYTRLPKEIDAAIYLAGINKVAKAEEIGEADWDTVMNVNLRGAFLFAKAAFPALKAAGQSCLVAISSIMVTHPYPGRLPYATAKAGLEGMMRTLAVEWGQYGIATHALRLGHISGLMKTTVTNPKLLDAVRQHTPLNKLIMPEEVASYIVWLAQGGCHSVSGSVIDFDPAYTINRWPL